MLNPPLRRKLVVLTLAGALLLPVLAVAAPRARRAPARPETRPVARSFFQELGANLVALWEAAGCELDPSGLCLDNPGEPGTSVVRPGPEPNDLFFRQ
jgi:hypothetical protein